MNFWHAFTTAPNKERAVASRLGQRGLLVLVPLEKRSIRSGPARKRSVEWAPAITGYVFVWMDSDWRAVERVFKMEFPNGEPCVRGIVKEVGGKFGKITEEAMQWCLQRIKERSEVSSVKHSLKAGDMVRVKNGPLAGQLGTVGSVEGVKVCLLTEMFKRSSPTTTTIHNLELATPQEKKPEGIGKNLHCGANQSTRYARDVGRSATGEVSRNNR